MSNIKLTELQAFQIRNAIASAGAVLNEIKLKHLSGKALNDMKTLESAVQGLECFMLRENNKQRG
jgi:hypothetical protein